MSNSLNLKPFPIPSPIPIPTPTPTPTCDPRRATKQKTLSEIEWQKLQAEAYGPRIEEAGVFPGVRDFFAVARARGVRAFIVSHKTRNAPYGDPKVSLREAAVAFLRAEGLLDCLRDEEADVFFADTRQEKCRRVETLCCATFVDDLLETFREPGFPKTTERLLFDPLNVYSESVPERRFESWAGITKHVFD